MPNNPLQHRLHIRKEALKFASAHMTVFADGTKEALHGHNYTVQLTVRLLRISLKEMVPFSVFKDALKAVCDRWDEKVLIAKDCPLLSLQSQGPQETEFTLCGKRYVLPSDELELIPVDNITTENLSAEVLRKLLAAVQKSPHSATVLEMDVLVEESPGQGGSSRWELNP